MITMMLGRSAFRFGSFANASTRLTHPITIPTAIRTKHPRRVISLKADRDGNDEPIAKSHAGWLDGMGLGMDAHGEGGGGGRPKQEPL